MLASRLGYRITALFADRFLGRIFETPDAVFPEEMLRPGEAGLDAFAAGVDAIVEAQKRVALKLFRGWQRGGAPARRCGRCCTSWRTANGRAWAWAMRACAAMFTREAVLASDWYKERLRAKQERDVALWNRHIAALQSPCAALAEARAQLARVSSVAYLAELMGTIGADP